MVFFCQQHSCRPSKPLASADTISLGRMQISSSEYSRLIRIPEIERVLLLRRPCRGIFVGRPDASLSWEWSAKRVSPVVRASVVLVSTFDVPCRLLSAVRQLSAIMITGIVRVVVLGSVSVVVLMFLLIVFVFFRVPLVHVDSRDGYGSSETCLCQVRHLVLLALCRLPQLIRRQSSRSESNGDVDVFAEGYVFDAREDWTRLVLIMHYCLVCHFEYFFVFVWGLPASASIVPSRFSRVA